MDLTTYSVCVLAGSAGGAVSGWYAGRPRSRRRRRGRGATGRSWPGGRRSDSRPDSRPERGAGPGREAGRDRESGPDAGSGPGRGGPDR